MGRDKLKFVSTEELFSVTDTPDFANRHEYVDTQELQEMFDNFNEDVDNNFTYLYGSGSASETLTNIDDYMILYLYSHYCSRSSGSSSGRSGRGGCSGDSRGGDCHDR